MLQQTHSVTFWHCQKMQKFYVFLNINTIMQSESGASKRPTEYWELYHESWSGGDFQRKSIEVTSEEFESITKHWDLNKSKKVLRILPSKSKLIFIEHQDIECLQVCKKKICANSGARLVESPFESYHLALLVLSTDLHRAPRGLKCSSAIKESAKSGRKGADSDVNLCSYINGNDLLLAPCPNWYRV